jgi:dephospho-CoA kinase
VFAPEEERRRRLKKERNYTDEKIDSIFENQSKEEAFRTKFTRVIENTGDVNFLEQQVDRLING